MNLCTWFDVRISCSFDSSDFLPVSFENTFFRISFFLVNVKNQDQLCCSESPVSYFGVELEVQAHGSILASVECASEDWPGWSRCEIGWEPIGDAKRDAKLTLRFRNRKYGWMILK